MLTDDCRILTDCSRFNFDSTIIAAQVALSEPHNEQVDWYNAVKQSNDILNTGWSEDSTLPDKYSVYRNKFISMPIWFKSTWDIRLGPMEAVQQRIKLEQMCTRQIHSAPYTALV